MTEPLPPTVENLLNFEAANPTGDLGYKNIRIRDTFGISAVRYTRLLFKILDDPRALKAGLAHDPQTVRRLERARENAAEQATARFGRR